MSNYYQSPLNQSDLIASHNPHPVKAKKRKNFKLPGSLIIVVLLQLTIIALLGYFFFIKDDRSIEEKVISAVDEKVENLPTSIPQVDRLDTIADVEELRNENVIQAEVYKDAKNSDYYLLYGNRLIIFRREENKVIYDGDTPSAILQQNELAVLNDIFTKSKELGIIAENYDQVPQVLGISSGNIDELKTENPEFYAQAQIGDIIVYYNDLGTVHLYRPEGKTIYNSGNLQTVISQ